MKTNNNSHALPNDSNPQVQVTCDETADGGTHLSLETVCRPIAFPRSIPGITGDGNEVFVAFNLAGGRIIFRLANRSGTGADV
jgi:hypothetical protein